MIRWWNFVVGVEISCNFQKERTFSYSHLGFFSLSFPPTIFPIFLLPIEIVIRINCFKLGWNYKVVFITWDLIIHIHLISAPFVMIS